MVLPPVDQLEFALKFHRAYLQNYKIPRILTYGEFYSTNSQLHSVTGEEFVILANVTPFLAGYMLKKYRAIVSQT